MNKLDRIYVSDCDYSGVKVVKSAVTSDHVAIVVYTGECQQKKACMHVGGLPTANLHVTFDPLFTFYYSYVRLNSKLKPINSK